MRLILTLVFILPLLLSNASTRCDTLFFYSDGDRLNAYYYPAKENNSTLIFTQGFMETGDVWGIGKTLAEKGINVFMFDFRGCFTSEGKQSLKNSQEDLDAALQFIKSEGFPQKYKPDTSNIILGGYSYGGHMSMLYAIYHPEIKKVISISGGDMGIFGELIQKNPELRKGYVGFFNSIKKPAGPVDFKYDDPTKELLDNLEYFSIQNQTKKLSDTKIFMTGGTDDSVVSLEDYVLPLYRKFKQNKAQDITLKIYQDNHSYSLAKEEMIKDVLEWIQN